MRRSKILAKYSGLARRFAGAVSISLASVCCVGTAHAKDFNFETMVRASSQVYNIIADYSKIDAGKVRNGGVKVCLRDAAPRSDNHCSEGVYWDRNVVHREGNRDNGRIVARLEPYAVIAEASGLQAAIFQDADSGDLLLAFAGTNFKSPGDLTVDFGLTLAAMPGMSTVYRKSNIPALFQSIMPELARAAPKSKSTSDLQVTGHSLGGFHAQMMAYYMPVKRVVTFNAPGAIPTARGMGWSSPKTPREKVLNIILGADEVGNYAEHFGPVTHYPKAWALPGSLHRIATVQAVIDEGRVRFRGGIERNKTLYQGNLCASQIIATKKFTMVACPLAVGPKFSVDRAGYIYTGHPSKAGMKCLTGSKTRSEDITLEHCDGSRSQLWKREGAALVNLGSGFCLDRSLNSGRLITTRCTKKSNQTFRWR